MGLTTAPGTFQRAMQTVLSGLAPKRALVYLDDILIFSETFEKHLVDLKEVLERFREYKLKIKAKKCNFCPKELQYLGYIITPEGLKPDPSKVAAVQKFPQPKTVTELRRFLGLTGFYRRFIEGY